MPLIRGVESLVGLRCDGVGCRWEHWHSCWITPQLAIRDAGKLGAIIVGNKVYCPDCGFGLKTWKCDWCGRQNDQMKRVCPGCGYRENG